ncbi:MAG: hypothetical protein JWQ42_3746, partial [Edaphobacter sp.]|nr:hypothetical protein [Edaphobacter sp.]
MYRKNARLLLRLSLVSGFVSLAVFTTTRATSAKSHKESYSSWSDYGGSADSMQYSAARQIDKSNV